MSKKRYAAWYGVEPGSSDSDDSGQAVKFIWVKGRRRTARPRLGYDGKIGSTPDVSMTSLSAAPLDLPANSTALDLARERLATIDPGQARIVELHFIEGRTVEATAEVLSLSTRVVEREWRAARAWLSLEMGKGRDA